ncbi:MAG TPA: hypothetical protein VKE74_33805 [Gemmataceae bacterium]|nr:hypothetical protein [Gemmataceae bacterium]
MVLGGRGLRPVLFGLLVVLFAVDTLRSGNDYGILSAVIGGVMLLAAGLIVWSAVTITVTLDGAEKVVRVERRGRWAESVTEEPLAAVETAEMETTTDSDGNTLHRVALRLTDGRLLPLTRSFDNRVRPKRTAVEAINRFLGGPG